MMEYPRVKLASLVDLFSGFAWKSDYFNSEAVGIPIIRIQNVGADQVENDFIYWSHEYDNKFVIAKGDLLLTLSGSFRIALWNYKDALLNQRIVKLTPKSDILDKKYLYYFINSVIDEISKLARHAIISNISISDLKNIDIIVPPLEEQRRIVAILDKADEIRQKRQQAIAKLDELLLSEFLKKFSNKNFKSVMVQDLLETEKNMRTGPFGSQLLHSEFVDEGIAVLGIDNAVKNQFQWGKPRFITEQKYQTLSRYTVKPNDVLITIMGTCGRCAVVPEDIPTAINTKHLCCITLDKTKCEPEFLHSYFLMHPTARNYLESRAKGAIMDGLNMGIIKELPVELPPLEDQKAFVKFKKVILSQKQIMDLDAEKIDQMFGSLQQKAFSGTL
ncbi:restriction endonuclease subunit S [Acinetobacter sp. YH12123]|uniref:restriction endonuclease subunit S n=1 Tax=Acinetobacter sp. YH12123 TaxID=2601108 RepID=UPI001C5511E9|nr:restriction endonuclease subunit S [Acinetobacter sp. YH12123]